MIANIPDRDGNGTIDERDLQFWGLPNYIDPRNETLGGRGIVEVGSILAQPQYNALADAALGLLIGNSAVHQIGLLVGLRETTAQFGTTTDIMTTDRTAVPNAGLVFTTADLAPVGAVAPVGIQNGPQLLQELLGTH